MKQFMSFIRYRHEYADFSRVSHAGNCILRGPTHCRTLVTNGEDITMANNPNDRSNQQNMSGDKSGQNQQNQKQQGMGKEGSTHRQEGQSKSGSDRGTSGQSGSQQGRSDQGSGNRGDQNR
jgi:hypothetical protein